VTAYLFRLFVTLCGVIFVLWLIHVFAPKDDTDPPDGRSGMVPRIDQRTGCQYLTIPFGGITPRVDAAGRHVGCK
jgi:hypothetical protein